MKRFSLAVLLASSLFASVAHAQCSTLVQSQLNWVRQTYGNSVVVTAVALKPGANNNAFPTARYFVASMTTYSSYPGFWWNGYYVAGWTGIYSTSAGSEYSSLRADFVSLPSAPATTRYQPFSAFQPASVDSLSLDSTGRVDLSFSSGAASFTATSCSGNVLSGFAADGTLYALTFQQMSIPG
ncbi:MAG: hypothetical protein ACOZQL_04120 [Myxococcota bacterium]